MDRSQFGPDDEQHRLEALYSYYVLDTEAEPRFDQLTELAARLFRVPVALLSLVDRDRLWFKSRSGLEISELPRDQAFCDYCIKIGEMLVVEDASLDPRFADNPLVIGPPHIRFYAGAPLMTPDGWALGTLNIIDLKPRQVSDGEITALAGLAQQAEAQLELGKQRTTLIDAFQQLQERNNELALHNLTLEQLNRGSALSEILNDLVAQIELIHPQLYCSIHLIDVEDQVLRLGAVARLKQMMAFSEADIPIGEAFGSCGTSAHRGERVIAADVKTDPLWSDHQSLLDGTSLRSCWSQPIKDRQDVVLGTFAIYQSAVGSPSAAEITMIERYANLAALAIEQKRVEQRVYQLAFFDALTDLPNRRLMEDRLSQAIAASHRSGHFCALMFIDLDNFKAINDTLGHSKGDILLQQVAERLLDSVRKEDSVARLGGDEFVVMLVNLNRAEAEAAREVNEVAAKILAALNRSYFLLDDSCRCTPSIGVTLFRGPNASVTDLLKQADLAMYRSKAAGRNAIHFFDPAMEKKAIERATLESDLRDAVRRGEFVLHYQAQVAGQGEVIGAEVLMRWQHPRRGLIAPAEFIPLAEETGLIVPLGRWALECACRQLVRWAGMPGLERMTIAVNISVHQIQQSDFVATVMSILEQTGAAAHRLKLELTESLLIDNVQDSIEKMTALKSSGIGFSLDDFGTGYSSLSYLKRLPLEQLKIDKSFVRDIPADINDATIARTIVALAQNLGFGVIAEGVETGSQHDFLAQSGCDKFQGFYFGRPLPAAKFEQYCLARLS